MTAPPRGHPGSSSPFRSALPAVVAVLLLALSMRIPTISLGPLLPTMRSDTGHGETFLSLLTAIPLALTLLVAPATPRVAARIGRSRLMGIALVGVCLGTVLRSVPGDGFLLVGTAVLGVAIAIGTVLAPAAITAEPRHRRALLTSVYSTGLSLGPALALGLTIPMMLGIGASWRGTLMLWALVAVGALVAWALYAGAAGPGPKSSVTPGSSSDEPATRARWVVGDPQVWLLAVYLGITSLMFYTMSTWLPTTLVLDGTDPGTAGAVASLVNLVAIPFAMVAPTLMRRGLSPLLAPLAPAIAAAGLGVLLVAGSTGAIVVALLLGISQGLCLGIAYGQIVQFATSPAHAGSVSAVTSAVGIALAAIGPLAFGSALEATGKSVVPVVGLGAVLVVHLMVGLRTGTLVDRR